mmetsp:Transcript_69600/g.185307  ORF Transcript_69600/g.185307 Transcript_69600/m.185307 type:complete len:247 (+) Transcript_69600:2417-3157(+)
MRPRRSSIVRCLHKVLLLLSESNELYELLWGTDGLFRNVFHEKCVVCCLTNLQTAGLRTRTVLQQIKQLLPASICINLQKCNLHHVDASTACPMLLRNEFENLVRRARDNTLATGIVQIPHHCVRLARPRYPIGKNGAVVTFHNLLYNLARFHGNILLGAVFIKDDVVQETPVAQCNRRPFITRRSHVDFDFQLGVPMLQHWPESHRDSHRGDAGRRSIICRCHYWAPWRWLKRGPPWPPGRRPPS